MCQWGFEQLPCRLSRHRSRQTIGVFNCRVVRHDGGKAEIVGLGNGSGGTTLADVNRTRYSNSAQDWYFAVDITTLRTEREGHEYVVETHIWAPVWRR